MVQPWCNGENLYGKCGKYGFAFAFFTDHVFRKIKGVTFISDALVVYNDFTLAWLWILQPEITIIIVDERIIPQKGYI